MKLTRDDRDRLILGETEPNTVDVQTNFKSFWSFFEVFSPSLEFFKIFGFFVVSKCWSLKFSKFVFFVPYQNFDILKYSSYSRTVTFFDFLPGNFSGLSPADCYTFLKFSGSHYCIISPFWEFKFCSCYGFI